MSAGGATLHFDRGSITACRAPRGGAFQSFGGTTINVTRSTVSNCTATGGRQTLHNPCPRQSCTCLGKPPLRKSSGRWIPRGAHGAGEGDLDGGGLAETSTGGKFFLTDVHVSACTAQQGGAFRGVTSEIYVTSCVFQRVRAVDKGGLLALSLAGQVQDPASALDLAPNAP